MPDEATTPDEPQDDGRERAIWLAMVGLGIVVTAIVLGLGWGVIGGRLAGARRIDDAVKTLKQTSASVNELDALLSSQIETETAVRAAAEIDKLGPEIERVDAIQALVTEHTDKLTDDERRQAAVVVAEAQAQGDLFREGIDLLRQMEPAWSVREVLDPAWDATLAADKLVNDSVAQYETHSRAGVQRASKMNAKARGAYGTTRSWFRGAQAKLAVVNLTGYIDYITARISAAKLAQQANNTWLAGGAGTAEQLIATYREKDAKLGLQLQIFPAAPSDWIDTSFRQQLELPSSKYYQARKRVQQGEEQLKNF